MAHRAKEAICRMTETKIVFFGSGPVAAASLRLIVQDFTVEAVITKTTTRQEMSDAAHGAPVYCADTKQAVDQLLEANSFQSTIGVLVDFGVIISQKSIDYFQKGILNSHFSLLPELRGADPISFAILEGRQTTGVSVMQIVEKMDEGPLLSLGEHPLTGRETTPELTEQLVQLSYSLLKDTVPAYVHDEPSPASGTVPTPQSQSEVCMLTNRAYTPSYTRKLTKQEGVIDWSKSAEIIDREIRAYAGWPKSRTSLGDVPVVITQAHVIPHSAEQPGANSAPGSLLMHDAQKPLCLAVVCGEDTLLCIEALTPAGKNNMPIDAFLRGYAKKIR